MKVPALSLKYDDLKLEGEPIKGELPVELCQEALGELVGSSGYWVTESIEATGHVYRTPSGEVIVDVKLSGKANFDCVSCGRHRSWPIRIREDLIIVPEKHEAATEEDVEGEGEVHVSPDLYTFQGQDIDLAEVFREVLILNAMTHPRCDHIGGECGPSLAEAGSDEVPETPMIDPRWAPLLAMQEALDEKEVDEEDRSSQSGQGDHEGEEQ